MAAVALAKVTNTQRAELAFDSLGGRGFVGRLLLALVVGVFVLISSGPAMAQGNGKGKEKPKRETRQTGSMSEKVYKRLSEAQQLSELEPPNYAGAMAKLEEIKVMKNLSPYEEGQLYNFYGFIYYSQERYEDAIRAYERVLAQPDLPPGLKSQITYTVAQLRFSTEDYRGAIKLINQWLANAENPGPDPYVLIATAHYVLKEYDALIQPMNKAMEIARARGKEVKEQWWLLLQAAYYEKKNYRKVLEILETLVVKWPKKDYWTQLSGMYGELENEPKQLTAYVSAYDQGLLATSSEFMQMAQLYLAASVPYKAGVIIETGLENGTIDKKSRNYRLLSQAWALAQEDERAIPALKKAASFSDDGDLDIRLAQSYLNLGKKTECIGAARDGIKKGGVKRVDIANMVLGMCLFEADLLGDAKTAFRKAAKDKRSQKNALSWLQYIESEELRLQQLERSLQQLKTVG
jgi:tetratricopeptide (TPR) repeat protein